MAYDENGNWIVKDYTHLGPGGRRRGRPKLPVSERTVAMPTCILPAQREWVIAFGDGNASLGMRKALDIAMQAVATKAAEVPEATGGIFD
jgi:hypothetical protein